MQLSVEKISTLCPVCDVMGGDLLSPVSPASPGFLWWVFQDPGSAWWSWILEDLQGLWSWCWSPTTPRYTWWNPLWSPSGCWFLNFSRSSRPAFSQYYAVLGAELRKSKPLSLAFSVVSSCIVGYNGWGGLISYIMFSPFFFFWKQHTSWILFFGTP